MHQSRQAPARARGLVAAAVPLIVACALPFNAGTASDDDIAELIAARLDLMDDVAAYKHLNDIAIEDKAREAVVLTHAVEQAEAAGLDGTSVIPFFTAQIEAAKAIQQCWIDRWQQGEAAAPTEAPDLQADIRPRLIDIGNDLIAAIAVTAADGDGFDGIPPPRLDCLAVDKAATIATNLAKISPASE